MGVACVLLLGLLVGAGRSSPLCLLSLPLAAGGLGVAGFHVFLEASGKLECPLGLFDQGTAPKQSLAVFTMLLVLLLADVMQSYGSGGGKFASILAALILGGAAAYGCIVSSPPLPPIPDKPYPGKFLICRPPYVPKEKDAGKAS